MTISEAKHKVISTANAEVGYREGENNWNKYAQELDPLGATWGAKQNMPWCGEFIIWLFYKCFGLETGLKMMYSGKPTSIPLCTAGAEYFKKAGKWYTSGPELGDIIFFYYSGGINHTGIVVSVSGGEVTTVEGNSSDKVSRNRYTVGSAIIAGYGRPNWALASEEPAPTKEEEKPEPEKPVEHSAEMFDQKFYYLRRGDGMGDREWMKPHVKAMQILLNGNGCNVGPYGTDGEFGPGTEAAVLAYQRRNGLTVDGVYGPQMCAKLHGFS